MTEDADSSGDDPRPMSHRGRAIALAVAGLAAVAGAAVAPDAWVEGGGSLEVRLGGELIAERPVQIGATEPVVVDSVVDDLLVRVTVLDGFPTDAATAAVIDVIRDDERLRTALGELQLTLVLPDGRREPIPVVAWDDEQQALTASRRPPSQALIMLALLGFVIVLWVTEAIPLFATSLLVPVVLIIAEVAKPDEALAPFFHPLIALFFGSFVLAAALQRVGLDRLAALVIVTRFGRSPAALFGAMLAASAVLSMWMANTAAAVVLLPIGLAVTEPIGHHGYRKAVVLGIAYAATVGGIGSAIGTPSNALAIEFVETFTGREISFAEWFGFGLPMVALFLPVVGVVLWRRADVHVDDEAFAEARFVAEAELAEVHGLTRDQWTVLGVFAVVVALWLTQELHDYHTGVVALGGAIALAALGQFRSRDLPMISWNALLIFGGGLTLGFALTNTGTADWLASQLVSLSSVPGFVAVAAVGLFTVVLTAVASNTASAAAAVPIAIPLAAVLGIDPVVLALVVAIASSIDFAMVIGTPPTMIAYSTGLFTPAEIFRNGAVLDLLGLAVLVGAVVWLWQLFGLV